MSGVELGIALVLLFILILLIRSGGKKDGGNGRKHCVPYKKPACQNGTTSACKNGKWGDCKCGKSGKAPNDNCTCQSGGWVCPTMQPDGHHAFCNCKACVMKVEHIIDEIATLWGKNPSCFVKFMGTFKSTLPGYVAILVDHPPPNTFQERKSMILGWLAGMIDGQRKQFFHYYMVHRARIGEFDSSCPTGEAAAVGVYHHTFDSLLSPY